MDLLFCARIGLPASASTEEVSRGDPSYLVRTNQKYYLQDLAPLRLHSARGGHNIVRRYVSLGPDTEWLLVQRADQRNLRTRRIEVLYNTGSTFELEPIFCGGRISPKSKLGVNTIASDRNEN